MTSRSADCCTPAPSPRARRVGPSGLVRSLEALGEPTRLGIVTLLAQAGAPVCVCDLVTRFDLRQPTVSHHLAVLKQAGLVSVRRQGRWSYYRLSSGALRRLERMLGRLARAPARRAPVRGGRP